MHLLILLRKIAEVVKLDHFVVGSVIVKVVGSVVVGSEVCVGIEEVKCLLRLKIKTVLLTSGSLFVVIMAHSLY